MRIRLPALNLFSRGFVFVIIVLGVMLASFAALGIQAVSHSTERTLQERQMLATAIAGRVDDRLNEALRIVQVMVTTEDLNPQGDALAAQRWVRETRDHLGNFAYWMAVLDDHQHLVAAEPLSDQVRNFDFENAKCVQSVLQTQKPTISCAFALGTPIPTVAMVIPVFGNGHLSGMVFTALDLTAAQFTGVLEPVGLGKTGYVEVVDGHGLILGSSRPNLVYRQDDHNGFIAGLIASHTPTVGTCHSCHDAGTSSRSDEVMAFAPLTAAKWGVALRQSRDEAFTYSDALKQQIILIGAAAFLLSTALTWLLMRQLVKPLAGLQRACEQIAAGNLDAPIPPSNVGEIGALARAFDFMRRQLTASLAQIQQGTAELEERVRQRTIELEDSRARLMDANRELGLLYDALREKEAAQAELLRKVIVAQEEERRRIARELHDETSQALTALNVGLKTTLMAPAETPDDVKRRLMPLKTQAAGMLEEVQRMIRDLRPSVLDDLGLISAIDWYAEVRLKSQGIRVEWEMIGKERRLAPELETTLFRVAQEAVSNIARHAGAENVSIVLGMNENAVTLEIEDDGQGFIVAETLSSTRQADAYGLLGMRERVKLFGGDLIIESEPGQGTRIQARIPTGSRQSVGSPELEQVKQ